MRVKGPLHRKSFKISYNLNNTPGLQQRLLSSECLSYPTNTIKEWLSRSSIALEDTLAPHPQTAPSHTSSGTRKNIPPRSRRRGGDCSGNAGAKSRLLPRPLHRPPLPFPLPRCSPFPNLTPFPHPAPPPVLLHPRASPLLPHPPALLRTSSRASSGPRTDGSPRRTPHRSRSRNPGNLGRNRMAWRGGHRGA